VRREARETIQEFATQQANEAANPCIRSMYPSRSRGAMANEFRHFIILGAEHGHSLAMAECNAMMEKMAEALDDVAVDVRQLDGTCPFGTWEEVKAVLAAYEEFKKEAGR